MFERQINGVEGGGGGHICPVMWWAGLLGRFKADQWGGGWGGGTLVQ